MPDEDHHFAEAHSGPFDHLDTEYLHRARRELLHAVPSDPTFLSHVGILLRSLITHELNWPARQQRDADARVSITEAQELAVRKALEDRHAYERGHLPPPGTPDADKAHADMEAKHENELADLDRRKRLDELDQQHVKERAELAAKHSEERAQMLGAPTPNAERAA